MRGNELTTSRRALPAPGRGLAPAPHRLLKKAGENFYVVFIPHLLDNRQRVIII